LETIRIRKLNHANLHLECDHGVAAEVREFFTFEVPGARYMPAFKRKVWDGKIRLFDANSGFLPAGLIQHLVAFCNDHKYEIEQIKTKYGLPYERNEIKGKNLIDFVEGLKLPFKIREYQFIGIMEALKRKRGILISPTGSGKSLIIYVLVRYWLQILANSVRYPHAGRVLVIVPTTGLVEQMYGDFKSYGQDELDMHRIYSGKDKNFDANICISTWQSIYKMPKIWYDQFGMVIGDECHGFKSKSLMNIMNKATEAAYRYGTTGTLDGTQTHELVLQGLFGKIYRVTTTKTLQDKDVLAQLHIKRLILDYSEKERLDFGQPDYMGEIDFIVGYQKRNNFIANLAVDLNGNSLVLFNYVEKHGKPLFELINNKVDEKRKVFFVSGEVATSDREAIRKIVEKQKNAIIVASLGTFSTGINIRNLHNIIFASPSKSQIRVLQSIGRGLRKSDNNEPTMLYDIIDNLYINKRKNFALIHSEERLKIYEKEQFTNESHRIKI
jgi:superfamily II DNA or RNA helicase